MGTLPGFTKQKTVEKALLFGMPCALVPNRREWFQRGFGPGFSPRSGLAAAADGSFS